MDKKIPVIVVLATLTTEIVLGEHHEHLAPAIQRAGETEAKPPAVVVKKKSALSSNHHSAPAQPHIEPSGSGPFQIVDFTFRSNQLNVP
jgi:hypothetical protein